MIDAKTLMALSEKLTACGCTRYAEWIKDSATVPALTKIAVVGENLKGKSSLINQLLGEDLMPVGIIPTECQIYVEHADTAGDAGIYTEGGWAIESGELDDALESHLPLTIRTSNTSLASWHASIIEYPGLAKIKDDQAFFAMSDICKCDCAILVTSAEQLLGITEMAFLEYFSKYTSPSRVLVVVSKLDLIAHAEVENVLRYAASKLRSKFPDIKYAVLQDIPTALKLEESWVTGKDEILSVISGWTNDMEGPIQASITNRLHYIAELVKQERDRMERSLLKQKDVRKQEQEKQIRMREIALTEMEQLSVEFQRRQCVADDKIKKEIAGYFDYACDKLLASYGAVADKKAWYESALPGKWESELEQVADKADSYACSVVEQDINWLSQKLAVHMADIDLGFLQFDRSGCVPKEIPGMENIPQPKKYILIGIGGGVAVGFYFFRFIGAVVCLGGGLIGGWLINNALMEKSETQDAAVRESITSEISALKGKVIKYAEEQVEEIYSLSRNTYISECSQLIELKYPLDEADAAAESPDRLNTLNEILKIMEEVL